MSNWSGRFLSLCGASLLALTSTSAFAKDVSIAAISGYFAQGFGVSIVQGLKKAETDLGVKVKLIDTGNRALDYEEQFNNVAKSGEYDLVFVMGWELVDALQKASAAYPDTRFVFIDGVLDSKTISYANFAQNQGSFLVGVLGAAMADKGSAVEGLADGKAIGFVGGRDIPVIRDFLAGYEQGAKYGAPDVRVDSVFAGTFDDPAKGSELTMALYGQGSDMVYNVAGPTGEGVLQASAAAGKYSIRRRHRPVPGSAWPCHGQHAEACGDVAVYSLVKDVVDGKGVAPGQTYTYDLKTGGVELLYCPDVAAKIPDDVKAKVEAAKADIISGKINSRHRKIMVFRGRSRPLPVERGREHNSIVPQSRTAMPLAIELKSITKRFGAFVANDAVDLAVESGKIHAIIGENGAGKTTLMNILFGLLQPDEGEIWIDGKQVTLASPASAIAAGIGMVHQHFKLVPSLTVADNVFLGMEICRTG